MCLEHGTFGAKPVMVTLFWIAAFQAQQLYPFPEGLAGWYDSANDLSLIGVVHSTVEFTNQACNTGTTFIIIILI